MTTNRELAEALAARTALAATAKGLTGRKATAAYRALEDAEFAVELVIRRMEMAVRAANPNADERTIQALVRAA